MFFLQLIILLINKLFLAGKDASSYLLKDKTLIGEITTGRINRWHRDGVVLDIIFTIVLAWATGNYLEVLFQSILLRLAVYDVAFNHWAQLNVNYLGSTAYFDRQFSKVFGVNGAIKKSIFFLLILAIWGILKLVL